MKDFWKKSNLPTILLSVMLSISLWAVVQLTSEKSRQQSIDNVPVRIENEQTLLTNTGFSIIEGKEATIRVDIEARGSAVAELNKKNMEDIYAVADVQAITEPGRTKVRYTLQYPNNLGISVRSTSPRLIEVWVDEVVTRDVPVEPYVEGVPAEGYLYDSVSPDRGTLTVRGPAQVVSQISYARATISAEGVTGSLTDEAPVTFLDREGNFVDAEENHLEILSGGVSLSLNVLKEGIVPLRVDVAEAPGLTGDMATVDVQPQSIKVRGEPALVDQLTQEGIVIGSVDLGTLDGDGTLELPIRTPSGVAPVAGEPRTAVIAVSFQNVSTRTFELDHIMVDLGDDEGWEAVLITGAVPVTVRGPSAVVDGMAGEEIQAVASLAPGQFEVGMQQAALAVTLEGVEGVAVIEAPESVNVMLRQVEGTEPEEPDGLPEGEGEPAEPAAGEADPSGQEPAADPAAPEGEAVA